MNNQGQMIQVQRQPQVVIQRPQQQPMFIQGGVQMQQVKIQPGGTIIRTPNGQVIKIGGGSGTGTPRSMTPSPQGSPFKIKVQPASDPATPTKTTISGKALFPGPQKMDFADTVQAARLQVRQIRSILLEQCYCKACLILGPTRSNKAGTRRNQESHRGRSRLCWRTEKEIVEEQGEAEL